MTWLTRTILPAVSGPVGAAAASCAALFLTLALTGHTERYIWEMAAALVLIRMIHHMSREPEPLLDSSTMFSRLKRMLVVELLVLVALAGAAHIMRWPVGNFDLIVYLTINLLLQAIALTACRLCRSFTGRHGDGGTDACPRKQVIIVGTGRRARDLADRILDKLDSDARLIGFLDYHRTGLWRYHDIPLVGHPDDLEKIIATSHVDALIIAVDPVDLTRTKALFESAERMGVTVFYMPQPFEPRLARPRNGNLCGLPTMVYRTIPESRPSLSLKTIIDRLGALAGLVMTAPLVAVSALAIKLESRGPVLFKQTRSGLNGRPFELYKLRTMSADAEARKEALAEHNEMSGPVFKIADDPRVTRIGRLLRKYSIDEIPQFLNVLRGEMSLVGPRPPLPREVSKYDPWQRRRLSVKPGVTCLWQVNGRNQIDFEEWMRLDLEYIDNWSLWLDARIMARTIPAVLRGSGS